MGASAAGGPAQGPPAAAVEEEVPDSIKALLVEPQRPQSPLRPSDDDEDDSKASGQVRRSLSSRLATQGERGCWKGTLGEADRTGLLTDRKSVV